MRRRLHTAGTTVAAALVVATIGGCAVGPSPRPDIAVERAPAAGQALPAPEDTVGTDPLPVPTSQPDWYDCTQTALSAADLPAAAPGTTLECAQIMMPIDPSGDPTMLFPADVLRARASDTPTDVAPLVLTTGSDLRSSVALAALASGPFASILGSRPVVALDRRGMGASQPLDCVPSEQARVLADLAQFSPAGRGGGTQADRLAASAQMAVVRCSDTDLAPLHGRPSLMDAFDSTDAAADLDALRAAFGVDRVGVLGIGDGARVATSFAAQYPDRVGRLVLDSPPGAGGDAERAAESTARGTQAAVDAFARQCTALACSLGPDPRAAIADLVSRAQDGRLAPVSRHSLVVAIRAALGSPRGDLPGRVRLLADTLSAARSGDVMPLLELVGDGEALLGSDGQFVARCSDAQRSPGPARGTELAEQWSRSIPVFGPDAALAATVCAPWPAASAPPAPGRVPVPVLVLAGAADPISGDLGLDTVTGALAASGTRWALSTWQGAGFGASLHSACSQGRLVEYLDSGTLPQNGSVCPA